MGIGVVRLGDMCTGHSNGFPPRSAIECSVNVLINGRGVVRVGDRWDFHSNGVSTHDGVGISGANTVVNTRPIMRIGDDISCGSRAADGSQNVLA